MLNYEILIRYVVVYIFFFSGLTHSKECPIVETGKTYNCNFDPPQVSGKNLEMYQNTPSGSKIGNVRITIPYQCSLNRQLILSLTADDSLMKTAHGNYFATNVKGIRFKFNGYSMAGGRDGRLPMDTLLHQTQYANKDPFQCFRGISTVDLDVYYFQDDSTPLHVGDYRIGFRNKPKIATFRWSGGRTSDDYSSVINMTGLPLRVKKTPCHVTNQAFPLGLFNMNDIMRVKNAAISKNINIKLSCESGPARTIEYSFSSQTIIHSGGLVDVEKSASSAEGVAYKVEHMVTGQAFNDIEMNRRESVVVNENELSPSIKLRITPIRIGDIKPGVANIHLTLTLTHN
jgi:hypothetical protein